MVVWWQEPSSPHALSAVPALVDLQAAHRLGGSTEPAAFARQRQLPYPRVQGPLAVSPSRGVGCVLAGTQVRS